MTAWTTKHWRNSITRLRASKKIKKKKSIAQRIISERMRARGPGDWFPGGCRAEPCWEREGKALTSEAKPSEQDAPGFFTEGQANADGSKASGASVPSSSTTAACGELCGLSRGSKKRAKHPDTQASPAQRISKGSGEYRRSCDSQSRRTFSINSDNKE